LNDILASAVSEYGDPRNPAIVFLHGIRLGREIWARHATVLARTYRVVTVDLPGHGALAGVPFTEDAVTELVDAAIERCTTSPPLLVGYSLGGFVAMRYAMHHPARTRALLLAGCTIDMLGWKWWPYDLSVRFMQLLPDFWLARFLHLTLSLTLPPDWRDIVEQIPFNRDVLAQTNEILRLQQSVLAHIGSYKKPVLFVNGRYDLVFRLDERRFLHRLPQARLRLIDASDHTAPLRRAGEFTAIVEQFARKVFAEP
jgi:pimeloyl-ACP methyl ester carboxylesterase